jgi:hypothetical protein
MQTVSGCAGGGFVFVAGYIKNKIQRYPLRPVSYF